MKKNSYQPLSLLPRELYPIIQLYLSSLDYLCLMNTSKYLFQEIKFHTISYQLTGKLTYQFLINDDHFCEKVLSKIKDPLKQINLMIEVEDFPADYEFQLNFPIHKLHFINYEITNLNEFSHIPNLIIYFFNSHIFNCTGLENVRKLELNGFFQLIDVSALLHLQEVTLCNCRHLSDISPLANVEKLKLIYCPNIYDVSCLGNVQDLTLEVCENISDITGLTNNTKIMIKDCPKIKNYTSLRTCEDITITPNMFIFDLLIFEKVKKLSLHHYTSPASAGHPTNRLSLGASTFPAFSVSSTSTSTATSVASSPASSGSLSFHSSISAVMSPAQQHHSLPPPPPLAPPAPLPLPLPLTLPAFATNPSAFPSAAFPPAAIPLSSSSSTSLLHATLNNNPATSITNTSSINNNNNNSNNNNSTVVTDSIISSASSVSSSITPCTTNSSSAAAAVISAGQNPLPPPTAAASTFQIPPSCRELILSECIFQVNHSTPSTFQYLSFLELKFCLTIRDEDIPYLSNIHTLRIINCLNIHTLKGLQYPGNYSIYIKESNYKNGIKDFSALKNIPKVSLDSCYHFISGQDVCNVHELILKQCHSFNDCIGLNTIQSSLSLQHCYGIDSLKGLENIPKIEIINLPKLTSLMDGLGNNHQRITFSKEFDKNLMDEHVYNMETKEILSSWLRENYLLDESRSTLTFLAKNYHHQQS